MSDFLAIYNEPTKEYFCFGKIKSGTREVARDCMNAAMLGDRDLFDLSYQPSDYFFLEPLLGMSNLWNWLTEIPGVSRKLKIMASGEDLPFYRPRNVGWWRCRGNIWTEENIDWMDAVGYLAAPARGRSLYGYIDQSELSALKEDIRKKFHHQVPCLENMS